jgi:hypothetical protein
MQIQDARFRRLVRWRRWLVLAGALLFGALMVVEEEATIAVMVAAEEAAAVLLFLLFVFILGLSIAIRQAKRTALGIEPKMSLVTTIVVAVAILGIDAIWLGLGVLSLLVVGVAIIWGAVALVVFRKDRKLRLFTLKRTAILLLTGLAGTIFMSLQMDIGNGRAEAIVAAVNQYHAKNGKYPDQLKELVPAFLPSVPRARISWVASEFAYRAIDESHVLSYLQMPPNVVRSYTFETQTWSLYE